MKREYFSEEQIMVSSLEAAIKGIAATERHIGIVDDKTQYQTVDRAHFLAKNRNGKSRPRIAEVGFSFVAYGSANIPFLTSSTNDRSVP